MEQQNQDHSPKQPKNASDTPHSTVTVGRQRLAEREQLEVYHYAFPDSDLKA